MASDAILEGCECPEEILGIATFEYFTIAQTKYSGGSWLEQDFKLQGVRALWSDDANSALLVWNLNGLGHPCSPASGSFYFLSLKPRPCEIVPMKLL